MKVSKTIIILLFIVSGFINNLSFATDEEIKNEIIELINETKRIWDTQNK